MNNIFVFGSNLKGIHGAGAALYAKKFYGAQQGIGVGLQGNSYAIPTKETPDKILSLHDIKKYVDHFIEFAYTNPQMTFQLTPIGCGLAGYSPNQIAPMFTRAPINVLKPKEFLDVT